MLERERARLGVDGEGVGRSGEGVEGRTRGLWMLWWGRVEMVG